MIAIIDLGTNTFHLLIAEVKGDGFEVVYTSNIPSKLGEGGIHELVIAPGAFERGVNAMLAHVAAIGKYPVERIRAVGTSMIRNARNGGEFCDRVRELTGIEVEVIDGDREAELIYKGVREAVDLGGDYSIIMDIGGGSVEFIICDREGSYWRGSFEIGAARLLERFHRHEPILREEVVALEKYLETELASLWETARYFRPGRLIGAAGSFDTFAEMVSLEMSGSPVPRESKSFEIPLDRFEGLYERLLGSTLEERLGMPGMAAMRADMIVVAAVMTRFVFRKLSCRQLYLSSYALKEGALVETITDLGSEA